MRNIPNLRFPEFSDEWVQTTLGKCSEALEYGMNSAAMTFDGENKYIRITDIDEASSKYIPDVPVSPEGNLEDKYLVNENDILLARTGASTGKSYLYNIEDGKLYFAGFLIRVKVNNLNNASFIFNQTKTDHYQKWVKIMSMRSGQPGINSREYASFKFWISSKPEQDRIANFLSLVDERIVTQNKIIEDYKTLKKGMVQKIFKQEIRFKDENGNTFESWKEKRLGEFLIRKSKRNKKLEINQILSVSNSKGFILQSEQFDNHRVASKDVTNYKIVKKNDIAYNPSRINVGSIAILKDYEKGIVSPMYVVFGLKDSLELSYFENLITTHLFNHLVRVGCSGSVRDSLNFEDLESFKLKFPCLEEQQKIAATLSAIDKKITLEEDYLDKLQAQKKYLLQNMFI